MAESVEKRKARHERYKARIASDPVALADFRKRRDEAKKRYEAKKKFLRDASGPVGSGKPGRLVARIGWMGW
jgi:hypothetical protein